MRTSVQRPRERIVAFVNPLRCVLGFVLAIAVVLVGLTASASAAVTAHGSIDQAYVLGAKKGQRLTLVDRKGRTVQRGSADRLGSKIFRKLKPGAGYRVRVGKGKGRVTRRFAVLRAGANPSQSSYRKHPALKKGLNYVTMRDGVQLAMTVRLPAGKTLADGPFPTLIEHSGYQTAAPKDLLSGLGGASTDPLVPASSTFVGGAVGPLLGFAVVSMQMRGSGCSGGAFDLFDLPTTYDNYDAIETVAAQSFVKRHKVGMAGISFSGITQLFAGGTQPPHLAALAPLSVTDDLYSATGYPGGIFNSGFAKSWITERMQDARPAPGGGQPYARALVKAGDKHCAANQKLRLQTENALDLVRKNPYRTPSLITKRSPSTWMGRIKVPTFLVGSFQDEQTSAHFTESLGELRKNKNVWITLQNGVHVDSLGPSSLTRWIEFLKLYVADEVPVVPPTVLALGNQLYKLVADAPAAPVRQSRFVGYPSVAAAKAVFRKDPRVRLLMDSGAGPQGLGSIGATWELRYDSWPVRQARATRYYLNGRGALTRGKPGLTGTARYTADPGARPAQTLTDDADAWKPQPPYRWTPLVSGKGIGFTTAPLAKDLVIAGASSLDVYVKSSARDTDLQATISEVRPDGQETYVQSGWLRASHRKLNARASTATDPVPTHLKRDAAPLPRRGYTLVRVPIYAAAHAFRAGSRIRVGVSASGGDRARWKFATVDRGRTRNAIAFGGARLSRLVLAVLPGVTAKGTLLPAPTALRGEPSRVYRRASNGG